VLYSPGKISSLHILPPKLYYGMIDARFFPITIEPSLEYSFTGGNCKNIQSVRKEIMGMNGDKRNKTLILPIS